MGRKIAFSLHLSTRNFQIFVLTKQIKTDAIVASVISRFGAAFRIRTEDLLITNQLLCQLS
jgi:hypothetical protein